MRKTNPGGSSAKTTGDTEDDLIGVIKIGHNQYIHLLDKNSNTTRLAQFKANLTF
jgi:hypothetical protein